VRRKLTQIEPTKLLLIGYASYVLLGWIVLCLPWCHEDASGDALDHLFTATSAVSTTGLATISTPASYSFPGELAIIVMIQFGGIGYMTLGSFVVLARRHELPEDRENVVRLGFSLPEGVSATGVLRSVVFFTAAFEIVGAIALFFVFRDAGVADPLWPAIFHSVSSFCTAGFSVFPDSLVQFADNFWVNAIVSGLSLGGAIGFLVLSDSFWTFTGLKKRRTLTTRIILHATLWIMIGGWIAVFLIEPSYRALPSEERLLVTGFQTISALTTVGFNSADISALSPATTLLVLLLMIVGSSPSGTGGGLKTTSVSAAVATVWSTLHGRHTVTFWGCRIPDHRLAQAFASVVFYILVFFVGCLFLMLVQDAAFEDILFEVASALGTVGLSRGLTAELEPLAKCLIVGLMFIGRLGPITFGLALFSGAGLAVPSKDDLAV
jgi:trk system potassium uptake protein TrkH